MERLVVAMLLVFCVAIGSAGCRKSQEESSDPAPAQAKKPAEMEQGQKDQPADTPEKREASGALSAEDEEKAAAETRDENAPAAGVSVAEKPNWTPEKYEWSLNKMIRPELERILPEGLVHFIFHLSWEKSYFVQAGNIGQNAISVETVSNHALSDPDRLNEKQTARLIELGFKPPEEFNYTREFESIDDAKLTEIAELMLTTMIDVFGYVPGTPVEIEREE